MGITIAGLTVGWGTMFAACSGFIYCMCKRNQRVIRANWDGYNTAMVRHVSEAREELYRAEIDNLEAQRLISEDDTERKIELQDLLRDTKAIATRVGQEMKAALEAGQNIGDLGGGNDEQKSCGDWIAGIKRAQNEGREKNEKLKTLLKKARDKLKKYQKDANQDHEMYYQVALKKEKIAEIEKFLHEVSVLNLLIDEYRKLIVDKKDVIEKLNDRDIKKNFSEEKQAAAVTQQLKYSDNLQAILKSKDLAIEKRDEEKKRIEELINKEIEKEKEAKKEAEKYQQEYDKLNNDNEKLDAEIEKAEEATKKMMRRLHTLQRKIPECLEQMQLIEDADSKHHELENMLVEIDDMQDVMKLDGKADDIN